MLSSEAALGREEYVFSDEYAAAPARHDDLFHFESRDAQGRRVVDSKYVLYGNESDNAKDADKRGALKHLPSIQNAIGRFWDTAGLAEDAEMTQEQYIQIHEKMSRALGVARPSQSAEAARGLALTDWEHDMQGFTAGSGGMPRSVFLNGLFELADVWTLGAEEVEYCVFLGRLFRRITRVLAIEQLLRQGLAQMASSGATAHDRLRLASALASAPREFVSASEVEADPALRIPTSDEDDGGDGDGDGDEAADKEGGSRHPSGAAAERKGEHESARARKGRGLRTHGAGSRAGSKRASIDAAAGQQRPEGAAAIALAALEAEGSLEAAAEARDLQALRLALKQAGALGLSAEQLARFTAMEEAMQRALAAISAARETADTAAAEGSEFDFERSQQTAAAAAAAARQRAEAAGGGAEGEEEGEEGTGGGGYKPLASLPPSQLISNALLEALDLGLGAQPQFRDGIDGLIDALAREGLQGVLFEAEAARQSELAGRERGGGAEGGSEAEAALRAAREQRESLVVDALAVIVDAGLWAGFADIDKARELSGTATPAVAKRIRGRAALKGAEAQHTERRASGPGAALPKQQPAKPGGARQASSGGSRLAEQLLAGPRGPKPRARSGRTQADAAAEPSRRAAAGWAVDLSGTAAGPAHEALAAAAGRERGPLAESRRHAPLAAASPAPGALPQRAPVASLALGRGAADFTQARKLRPSSATARAAASVAQAAEQSRQQHRAVAGARGGAGGPRAPAAAARVASARRPRSLSCSSHDAGPEAQAEPQAQSAGWEEGGGSAAQAEASEAEAEADEGWLPSLPRLLRLGDADARHDPAALAAEPRRKPRPVAPRGFAVSAARAANGVAASALAAQHRAAAPPPVPASASAQRAELLAAEAGSTPLRWPLSEAEADAAPRSARSVEAGSEPRDESEAGSAPEDAWEPRERAPRDESLSPRAQPPLELVSARDGEGLGSGAEELPRAEPQQPQAEASLEQLLQLNRRELMAAQLSPPAKRLEALFARSEQHASALALAHASLELAVAQAGRGSGGQPSAPHAQSLPALGRGAGPGLASARAGSESRPRTSAGPASPAPDAELSELDRALLARPALLADWAPRTALSLAQQLAHARSPLAPISPASPAGLALALEEEALLVAPFERTTARGHLPGPQAMLTFVRTAPTAPPSLATFVSNKTRARPVQVLGRARAQRLPVL